MRIIFTIVFLLLGSAAALSDEYTCGDFVHDQQRLFSKQAKFEDMKPFYHVVIGFIDGVFHASRKVDKENGASANAKFTIQVMQSCQEQPEKNPNIIALKLVEPKSVDTKRNFDIARDLGLLLASEKYCEVKYQQEAIDKFVERTVDANDLSFTRKLNAAIRISGVAISDLTTSQKTAHCKSIIRSAQAYEFLSR
jgi:hypothetical protein